MGKPAAKVMTGTRLEVDGMALEKVAEGLTNLRNFDGVKAGKIMRKAAARIAVNMEEARNVVLRHRYRVYLDQAKPANKKPI